MDGCHRNVQTVIKTCFSNDFFDNVLPCQIKAFLEVNT
jgi:hypothetical protein